MKIKRGYRYQVSEPVRKQADRPDILVWNVLDTSHGEGQYPIVAMELTRAAARATAKRLNDGHQNQKLPVPGL